LSNQHSSGRRIAGRSTAPSSLAQPNAHSARDTLLAQRPKGRRRWCPAQRVVRLRLCDSKRRSPVPKTECRTSGGHSESRNSFTCIQTQTLLPRDVRDVCERSPRYTIPRIHWSKSLDIERLLISSSRFRERLCCPPVVLRALGGCLLDSG
jgi:hypothetical protein